MTLAPRRLPFVARDVELAELDRALGEVLSGRGCVRLVVGEAGSGKTALIREFAERAQQKHEDLIVAVGQCDAQTGIGDAFLPFREVLALLTGDVDAKLATGEITQENAGRLKRFIGVSGEAIVELGPDLIGTLIPGVGLATRAAAFIAKKTGHLQRLEELADGKSEGDEAAARGIVQRHIYEQYTNVVARLAASQPLLVIVDDLQWADAASAGLLFRLGRSIADSRIMLVGTFRPAEVAFGRGGDRHPIEKVVTEFKRCFGDVSVDLHDVAEGEGRRFVDALLDAETNRLSPEFRTALFNQTSGHPLFTIELLRSMKEAGTVRRDEEGCWVAAEELRWDALPARIEGVIEERLGRLDADALETLTVASVVGEQFVGETVAHVRDVDARSLVRRLGRDLEQRHGLVRSQGLWRCATHGIRLSKFVFQHNLLQRYMYLDLSDAERVYLHEDVGGALESLCSDCSDEFVVQLARHFSEAGVDTKAADYLRRAGELSAQRFANDEAIEYLTRALSFSRGRDVEARWSILCAREAVLGLQGARQAQAEDLEALRRLATDSGNDEKRTEFWVRRAHYARVRNDYAEAIAAAEAAVALASARGDVVREAKAWLEWGYALLEQGQHDEARHRLARALGFAEGSGLPGLQANCVKALARIHSERGEFVEAAAGFREALLICRRTGDTLGEAAAVNNLGVVAALQGDLSTAGLNFEKALECHERCGDLRQAGVNLHNLGELATDRHDYGVAQQWHRRALRNSLVSSNLALESASLRALGCLAVRLGFENEVDEHLRRSLEMSQEIGNQAEISASMAWLAVVACGRGEYERACTLSRQARDIARSISDQRLEGRALDALGQALEASREWEGAAAAFEDAMLMQAGSGDGSAAAQSASYLARIALSRDDVAAARDRVEGILAHLETGNLQGTDFPVEIYLTCYRVLEAAGDVRAASVLAAGRRYLAAMAERIDDVDVRRSFLENVPVNRTMIELADGRSF